VFPSFENDVVPVLSRLKSPKDKAILTEWCASQYEQNDEEKMKCIDLVVQCAMQTSTEIEHRYRLVPNDRTLETAAVEALNTVKRVSARKSSLTDKLHVTRFLSQISQRNDLVYSLIVALLSELETFATDDPNSLPEALVDFLYDRGSALAASACLNPRTTISVQQFRLLCSSVHKACKLVAEQHSHMDCGRRARRFAQRWLFYGDEDSCILGPENEAPKEAGSGNPPEILSLPESETVEFVMDLAELQSSDAWIPGVGSMFPKSQSEQKCSLKEEASAWKDHSARELSETSHQRASLRIAFVMAFAIEARASEESSEKENAKNSGNLNTTNVIKRPNRLRILKNDSPQDNQMFCLCRELLQIVFASSYSPSLNLSNSSFEERELPKTITFAMRHRALRAAAFLCPQEALSKVARDEGFLFINGAEKSYSLKHATFGVFVAKEIEEMGLPLPHSDLGMLCTMNFASYSRTLWRHHRDDGNVKSNGRLLLLLTELCLHDGITDAAFVCGLFEEMIVKNLPRCRACRQTNKK
jgi:hypothetical protein